MKNKLIMLCMAAVVAFTGACKKKESDDATLDEQTKTFYDDGNRYKGESDQSNTEANTAIDQVSSFGRGIKMPSTILTSPICGLTIDSSQASQHILTLVYDSTTYCSSRIRAGKIKIQLTRGAYWGEVNSQLTFTYMDFRVIYFINNQPHQVVFNGVKTLDNLDGNDWLSFLAGSPLHYRERALNISVNYDNGAATATWNSARLTQWNYSTAHLGTLTFTASGDSSVNGYSSVDSWGTNRFGQTFTTNYNSSLVSNSYCGLWKPISGELTHHVNGHDFIFTLGVNPDGSPRTGDCGYGLKVTWTPDGGSSTSVVFAYWY